MSQAGGRKKVAFSGKSLPITFHPVHPGDKSRHSNLTLQTCPYGYMSSVTLSISANRAKTEVGQEHGCTG